MDKVEVFKPTQDDWSGSYRFDGRYEGDENQMLVAVMFLGNICASELTKAPVWRTSVWGNDDYGMEYDCDNETEAWTMFLQVIKMEFVNKEALRKLGYTQA
jgi:hypothetical protein